MKLDEVQRIAEEIGRTAYEARLRPAQEGDILLLQVARDRTPIDLQNWVHGCWNKPPPMGKLVEVIGDYDVIRVSSETKQQIRRMWGKCYLASPVGAEFVTFSTQDAYVLSKHEQPENPDKRVIACLAEGFTVAWGREPGLLPSQEDVMHAKTAAEILWSKTEDQNPLRARYRTAPLLLGWPAPGWENMQARAFVRCAMNGGKERGKHYTGLVNSWVVPNCLDKEG